MADDYGVVNDQIVKTGGQHEIVCSFTTVSIGEMINHLEQHEETGQKVPSYAYARLKDYLKNGDTFTID